MPRRSSGEYRTALGAFIEEWRRSRDWTQIELQNTLGVAGLGDRYVSKVESGQIRQPRKDFLQALAALTGVTIEELSGKVSEAAPAPSLTRPVATPRVLFGHCLWGAPVFIAAESGLLAGFRVASFEPADYDSEDDPAWIGRRLSSADLAKRGAPLSAANVLNALRRGQAEIGIVPGDFARRHPEFLLRVGVVFDGPAGMVLLARGDEIEKVLAYDELRKLLGKEWSGDIEDRISSRVIGAVLSHLSRHPQEVSGASKCPALGFDGSTVAREIFEHIKRAAGSDDAVDKCRWHVSTTDLASSGWENLEVKLEDERPLEHFLFGVITWDPLATWIMKETGQQVRRNLLQSHIKTLRGRSSWPRHLTFEIVIRQQDANDRTLIGHLERLLSQLWQVTAGSFASQDSGLDAETLDLIAGYFGLGDQRDEKSKVATREHVEKLLLAYRYVTYWYEGTRSMLSARRGPA